MIRKNCPSRPIFPADRPEDGPYGEQYDKQKFTTFSTVYGHPIGGARKYVNKVYLIAIEGAGNVLFLVAKISARRRYARSNRAQPGT